MLHFHPLDVLAPESDYGSAGLQVPNTWTASTGWPQGMGGPFLGGRRFESFSVEVLNRVGECRGRPFWSGGVKSNRALGTR